MDKFFCLLICTLRITKLTKLEHKYNKDGSLYNWYDITFKIKGTLWLKDMFDQLIVNNILNYDSRLIIISPSANKGTYEKELFNHICRKNIITKFMVTDLNLMDNYEQSFKYNQSEYIYLHEKNDAKEIKQILNAVNETNTNIIIDLEGCLWHVKEDNWFNKVKCMQLLIDMFEKYYEVLTDNGLIIIDNRNISKYEVFLRYLNNFMSHLKLDNSQYSTGHYLFKLYNKNSKFKQFIDNKFVIYKIDAVNEYDTIISTVIYKKR